jgi:hypothetical protein
MRKDHKPSTYYSRPLQAPLPFTHKTGVLKSTEKPGKMARLPTFAHYKGIIEALKKLPKWPNHLYT